MAIKKTKHKLYLWPIIIIFLSLLFFPFLAGLFPIVYFTEEEINIHVYSDHVTMHGEYAYENPFSFSVIQGFSIPLPIDDKHPDPVRISVNVLNGEKRSVPIRMLFGSYRFELTFKPKQKILVCVFYEQFTPTKDAHYILTTTQPWRRPLKNGIYRLWPNDVNIISSNFSLERLESKSLGFERTHFMPTSNWHFTWDVRT